MGNGPGHGAAGDGRRRACSCGGCTVATSAGAGDQRAVSRKDVADHVACPGGVRSGQDPCASRASAVRRDTARRYFLRGYVLSCAAWRAPGAISRLLARSSGRWGRLRGCTDVECVSRTVSRAALRKADPRRQAQAFETSGHPQATWRPDGRDPDQPVDRWLATSGRVCTGMTTRPCSSSSKRMPSSRPMDGLSGAHRPPSSAAAPGRSAGQVRNGHRSACVERSSRRTGEPLTGSPQVRQVQTMSIGCSPWSPGAWCSRTGGSSATQRSPHCSRP